MNLQQRRLLILRLQVWGRRKNRAGKTPPPDSDPFSDVEFGGNLSSLSRLFAASADRRFQFQKSRQLFIGMHNETLPVVAVCVSNPDRSPVGINR
jgi:hypothetical protein